MTDRESADRRLAVYGTLAPGRENHYQLAGLQGRWRPGTVRGTVLDSGWGSGEGYPALLLEPAGPVVAVQVFESDDLPSRWAQLDEFEGTGYRRVVATVQVEDGEVPACIYVANT
ncbi:MAG: gamma-glutamylcyclotransferase family protein [Bryobacteraceae bacterium]